MRRLIAVLVLLGGGGIQLAAVNCPLAIPAEEAVAASHEMDHQGHGGHDTDGQEPVSHHSGAGCGLAMACGTAAVLTQPPMTTRALPTSVAPVALTSRGPSTTFPAHEPPPPRLMV